MGRSTRTRWRFPGKEALSREKMFDVILVMWHMEDGSAQSQKSLYLSTFTQEWNTASPPVHVEAREGV